MLRVWLASGLVRLPLAVRLPLELKLLANEVEPSVVPHRSSAGGGGFYSWACFSLAPIPPSFPFSFIDVFVGIGIS